MEKPISLIIEEAKTNIANAVNGTNLHPSILLPIIKNVYEEVLHIAQLQYNKEKQEYEIAISKEKQNNVNEESTEM